MIWAAISSAGVGPLCFIKFKINAAVYQEILDYFMLPSADKLFGDADFILQQDLRPTHSAKTTSKWFADCDITVTDWPENLWGIVKRKISNIRRNNTNELKATIKATWASVMPQEYHRLIASMPRRIEAVIHAKGALTKY